MDYIKKARAYLYKPIGRKTYILSLVAVTAAFIVLAAIIIHPHSANLRELFRLVDLKYPFITVIESIIVFVFSCKRMMDIWPRKTAIRFVRLLLILSLLADYIPTNTYHTAYIVISLAIIAIKLILIFRPGKKITPEA